MHICAQNWACRSVVLDSIASRSAREGRSTERNVGFMAHKEPWRPRLLAALMFCAALLPTAAQAAPTMYAINGGTAGLSVVVNGTEVGNTVSGSLTGNLTIDQSAQTIDEINVVLEPNIGLSLSSPYGGYDSIVIESASIAGGLGYTSSQIASTGTSFTVLGGPLEVNGTYGATDSLGVSPSASGIPITYTMQSLTGVVTSTSSVAFNAFTLNALNGAGFGETDDLIIFATINITPSSLTVIPEPSTALLVSMGLGLLADGSRRRSE